MGGNSPFAGIGALLQGKMGDGDSQDNQPGAAPPGGPNPMGAMMAQKDAIEKVLKQMATQLPTFGPYGDRAMQIITMGIEAGAKSQAGGGGAPEPPGSPTMVSPLGEGAK